MKIYSKRQGRAIMEVLESLVWESTVDGQSLQITASTRTYNLYIRWEAWINDCGKKIQRRATVSLSGNITIEDV